MAEVDRDHMMRRVRQLGQRDKHFTFSEVRDSLGVATEHRELRHKLWNWWKALERDGLVEEVAGKRKRNRYYRIADAKGFEVTAPGNGGALPQPGRPAALDRLSRIERRVDQIDAKVDELRGELVGKLDQILAIWS
jgi:hypothetical protein